MNHLLCEPKPLPEQEIDGIWKSALEFVAINKKEDLLQAQQSSIEELVEVIMSKYKIKTLMDTEEIVYYKDGIYRLGGEQIIKVELEEIQVIP